MEYACIGVYLILAIVHMFIFAPETSKAFRTRGIPVGLSAAGITIVAGLIFPLIYLVGGLLMVMEKTK